MRNPRLLFFLALFSLSAHAQLILDCLSITCPADIVTEATSPDGAQVYFSATGTNRCNPKLASVTYRPRPGSWFPLGTNVVRATISDGSKTESCSFRVIVRDTTAPRVLAPRILRAPCESSSGAIVKFAVAATDNYDTNVLVQYSPASGSLFPKGTNIVRYAAEDSSGNRRSGTFPLVVEGDCPVQCLVITAPDITQVVSNKLGKRVFYNATVDANCSRHEPTITYEPKSGSTFFAGESIVWVTVTQGIFSRKASFKVILQDVTPPVLNVPSNLVVEAQGSDGAVVNFNVTATDDCSTNIAVHSFPESGSLFPIGRTAVTSEAVDEAGNRTVSGFMVTVDRPKPRIGASPTFRGRYEVNWAFAGKPEFSANLSQTLWTAWSGTILSNGLNRTITFTPTNQTFFVRIPPQPTGHKPDADGDGVLDKDDKCPKTLPGKLVDDCGCSPVQITRTPGAALDTVNASLTEALRLLEADEIFEPIRAKLAGEKGALNLSGQQMKSGSLSNAVNTISNSFTKLKAARDEMALGIQNFQRTLPRNPQYGDVDADDVKKTLQKRALKKVSQLLDETTAARKSFDFARRSVSKVGTISGTITKVDSGGSQFTTDDGLHVEFSSSYQEFIAAEDSKTSGSGITFNDGTAMMTESDRPGNVGTPNTSLNVIRLRIAPFQAFKPSGPWILHDPRGYFLEEERFGAVYYIERGARFAAMAVMNPPPDTWFYALRLDFSYPYGNETREVTLAPLLKPGDLPVGLPGDFTGNHGTLTVTKIKFPKAGLPGEAVTPEILGTETYSLDIRERYSYARAEYTITDFFLEDSPEATGYGITSISSILHAWPMSQYPTAPQFTAEAFLPAGPATTFPVAFPIPQFFPFAIIDADFYVPEFGPLTELVQGTDRPSGLRWPRVTGFNNGFPYTYSVEVPRINRDMIANCNNTLNCSNDGDSYYRLPFRFGYPTWQMSQGNCGDFTHKGDSRFAFDMAAADGTEIRAARGGMVTYVDESNFQNCCPNGDCPETCSYDANTIEFTHSDGTRGLYYHMRQNGVYVAEGMRVRRGDPIGQVGNTGYSTGPHLHFEVGYESLNGYTVPIRFQMWTIGGNANDGYYSGNTLMNCALPDRNSETSWLLFSNNRAWWE